MDDEDKIVTRNYTDGYGRHHYEVEQSGEITETISYRDGYGVEITETSTRDAEEEDYSRPLPHRDTVIEMPNPNDNSFMARYHRRLIDCDLDKECYGVNDVGVATAVETTYSEGIAKAFLFTCEALETAGHEIKKWWNDRKIKSRR